MLASQPLLSTLVALHTCSAKRGGAAFYFMTDTEKQYPEVCRGKAMECDD